ncbi:AfsR/SARP family transcriptional regulator [Nocardiopsis suaedae]|uniref:Tetratricopeptide repeat protein n=1 Tax=Nocardiopsis suaedae TaxID=3018444 RepID=A0ABT4THY9_9ACTN|nr:tetratricopeptide repeat protein [Nocardiopsis suaedae]MDA2803884.1 tetratricopeptide repeat protein [Nocardiopsis suaedae]
MELRVLGPVRLVRDGRDFPLGSGKQLEIAVLLALEEGRPLSRESIVELVWNGGIGALSTLDSYMSRTRRHLEAAGADRAALVCESGHYRLDLGADAVDWPRFRRLCRAARARERAGEREPALELLEEALGLWRGTPLTGLSGDWALRRREAMVLARRDAAADHGRLLLESGRDPRDLLDALHAEAGLHPGSEPVALNLATALLRAGHRAEAAGVCRRLAEHLHEQGVAPGAALRHLLCEAEGGRGRDGGNAQGAPAAPPTGAPPSGAAPAPPPDTLPRDLHDFHGRAAELERIAADLRAGAAAVVVSGMPGVGKTALVCRAAHGLSPEFPDGRLLVDLHGSGTDRPPRDPAEALHEMLGQLGVPAADLPEGTEARARLWRTLTAPLRLLAVLDDAADPEQVRPLLPGGRHSAALVTSRIRMASLEGSRALGLVAPAPEEAVGLVAAITGCDPRADGPGLSALARRMDRLPHPLRLLASWWRHAHPAWPLAHLVERLDEAAPRFTGPVAAALAASAQGLPPPARAAFVRLGLLPSTAFGTHAAAAAIGATAREAEPVLELLSERSLVEEPGPPGRWRLHALTADFARRTAQEELGALEEHAVLSRVFDQWLAAADAADRARFPHRHRRPARPGAPVEAPGFAGPDEADAWFAAERGTLLDLLPGSGGAHPASEGEAFAWHRAELALRLAGFLSTSGAPDREATAFQGAARTFRDRGDAVGYAHALNELVAAHLRAERLSRVAATSLAAIDQASTCGDEVTRAQALSAQGLALSLAGHADAALPCIEEALAVARHEGHVPTVAQSLHFAAIGHSVRGAPAQALGSFHEALTLYEAVGDQASIMMVTGNMARVMAQIGKPAEALRLGEEALRLAEEAGRRGDAMRMRCNIGELHADRGELSLALECFQDALETARAIGDTTTEIAALAHSAHTRLRLGQPTTALSAFAKAQDLASATDAPADMPAILMGLGEAYAALRDFEEAEVHMQQALHRSPTSEARAHALTALGHVAHRRGDAERSQALFDAAARARERSGTARGKGDCGAPVAALNVPLPRTGDSTPQEEIV